MDAIECQRLFQLLVAQQRATKHISITAARIAFSKAKRQSQ